MTTSNTAAAFVQFVQVNQAAYLLVEKSYLTTVTKGLKKLGIAFSTNNLNGRVQVKLINLSERLWNSLNAKYPCHKTGSPKLYVKNEGTFYRSTNGFYQLGLTVIEAANVVPRLNQLGIKFQNVTSWNDRYDGRVRIRFINLTPEQLETLTLDYGNGSCYQAVNPNKPAPKKQAKPAAKENLWSWGTTDKVPTVTLEQLEAIAASKQSTPVEVQPDTDSTPSEQTPHEVDTTIEAQPDVERTPSVQAPDTGSTPTKFATKTDFVNLDIKQLRNLADELGIDKTQLKTELAKALAEASHFPQTTIQAMKKKK